MICIAGSLPDKILDWIITVNTSDGLFDPATREKFPHLIFHGGMLADITTFLSRFGSTAREDAGTSTSGEEGNGEGKEEEEEEEREEGEKEQQTKGQSLDSTIKEYGIKRIMFTGHSKGGGEAQALHMLISELLALPGRLQACDRSFTKP
jgi:hypothetical protein